MIDKNKQYRTRDGREVRIYATDGNGNNLVHGAIHVDGEWVQFCWMQDGSCDGKAGLPYNLIEVRPRHKRTVWLNVYEKGLDACTADSREEAEENAASARLACIKVELDFEEGEGL
jgi:hypothetical protein